MNIPRNLAAFSAFVLVAGSASASNVIVNGDFETGDLSGWTQNGTGTTVSNTSPLAGTYSAVQVPGAGSQLFQTFTPFTVGATTSFVFSATDPGNDGTRSMNVTFRGTGYIGGSPQINLRLTDVDDNGFGDIQAYDGTTWQTVLTSAVTFNTETTFLLVFRVADGEYDLTVGGNTATGITHFHNGAPADFAQLAFVNSSITAGSSCKFDNVSVVSAAPFVVTITPNGANYDITWNSQTGKTYDLVSSTDLSTTTASWAVWESHSNIAGTGSPIKLSNVPGGGPTRFFAVVKR